MSFSVMSGEVGEVGFVKSRWLSKNEFGSSSIFMYSRPKVDHKSPTNPIRTVMIHCNQLNGDVCKYMPANSTKIICIATVTTITPRNAWLFHIPYFERASKENIHYWIFVLWGTELINWFKFFKRIYVYIHNYFRKHV